MSESVGVAAKGGYAEHLSACVAHLKAGELESAIAFCRRVLAQNPADGGAYDLLGLGYCHAIAAGHDDIPGLIGAALDAFDKARRCPRPLPLFHLHVAQLLNAVYRVDEALMVTQQAVAVTGPWADLKVFEAMLLGYCFRGEEALRVYDQLVEHAGGSAKMVQNFRQIANAIYYSGNFPAALAVYDDVYKRDRGFLESAGYHYIGLLKAAGRSSESQAMTEELIAAATDPAEQSLRRIAALEREGKYDAAEALWRALLDQDGANPAWQFGLANHLAIRSRWHECPTHLTLAKAAITGANSENERAQTLAGQIESLTRGVEVYAPRMTALLAVPPEAPRTPGADVVVIRGGIDALNVHITKLYRACHAGVFIILSTWDDTDPKLLEDVSPFVDELLLNRRPETGGYANFNYQVTWAAAGLERAKALGAERVLLTRTDVALLNAHLIAEFSALLEAHRPDHTATTGLRRKLIVSEIFTATLPLYHVSDIVCYGTVDDVSTYWSPEIEETCLRPEVYLTRRFAAKVGRAVKNDFNDSWATIRDLFIVKDADSMGWFWQKYPAISSIAKGRSCWTESAFRDYGRYRFKLEMDRLPRLGDG